LARQWEERRLEGAEARPFAHTVLERRRFLLPGDEEVWTERWRAPAGVQLERIEMRLGGQYLPMEPGTYYCRQGQDVAVMWPSGGGVPHWRVYWRDAQGRLAKAEWQTDQPAGDPQGFAIDWRSDGFALPAPVSSGLLALDQRAPDGSIHHDDANRPASAGHANDCLERWTLADGELPIVAIALRIWRFDKQQTLRPSFERPG
jgi:hypothetical protein